MAARQCPLLAQSGHWLDVLRCPLMTQSGHCRPSDPSTSSERVLPATMLPPMPGSAMRRRDFIKGIAGSTVALPFAARAEQADRVYRIGYLSLGSPSAEATRYDAFRAALAALGYVEGKNLVIETRWLAGGKYDQLTDLAAQLVDLKVNVLSHTQHLAFRPPSAQQRQSL